MAQHYLEITGIILLLIFAATMFYHGTMIMKNKHGYWHMDHKEWERASIRKRIEELLKDK
jgi:ABC-type nickel/cobalt efflux system permease component RcnA